MKTKRIKLELTLDELDELASGLMRNSIHYSMTAGEYKTLGYPDLTEQYESKRAEVKALTAKLEAALDRAHMLATLRQ